MARTKVLGLFRKMAEITSWVGSTVRYRGHVYPNGLVFADEACG